MGPKQAKIDPEKIRRLEQEKIQRQASKDDEKIKKIEKEKKKK